MINIFKNENVKVIKPKEDVDVVAILDSNGNKIFQTDESDFEISSKYPIDLQYLIDNDKLDIFDKNSEKFDIILYTIMFFLFFEFDLKRIGFDGYKITSPLKYIFEISTYDDEEKLKDFLSELIKQGFQSYISKTRFNIILYLEDFQPEIKTNIKLKNFMFDFFSNQEFYISKMNYNVIGNIKKITEKSSLCVFKNGYENYYTYKSNNNSDNFYLEKSKFIRGQVNLLNLYFKSLKENEKIEVLICSNSDEIKYKSIISLDKYEDGFKSIHSYYNNIYCFFIRGENKILNNKYHINGWVRIL